MANPAVRKFSSATIPTPSDTREQALQRPHLQPVSPRLELHYALRDFERFPLAPLIKKAMPRSYSQCLHMQISTRSYAKQAVYGHAERLDQEIREDHSRVPWELINVAAPYGFFSMNLPAIFGGGNHGTLSTAIFAEEISAADAGVFVIFGAHALALSLIMSSMDLRMTARLAREIVAAEKSGEPLVLALAHTEAGGGSDVEDVDDICQARIGSRYTRVPGGYRVRARKIFISNGSIARYNVVTAYGDSPHPLDSAKAFVIPQAAEGFSVGRLEHKLGQRLSTAVEILCDDVFVPEADSVDLADHGRSIDTTLSLTRGPVGAMSTGIIRGTLERVLAYLQYKRIGEHFLYEEQHVQLALADMISALQAARGMYMDAALAVEHWGLGSMMRKTPQWIPRSLAENPLIGRAVTSFVRPQRARAIYERQVSDEDLRRTVAHSSLAKFTCSDLAVRVAMRAMELLGEDANDPRWGVEKQLRDAKLAQIFEGTNQINRLHVTRGMLRAS